MKRFALFGTTVLLPCVLLILFGYRIIRQDRELAVRHAEDEKRARTLEQRQRWLGELEKANRTAIEEFFARRKSSAEFTSLVIDQQISAPWELPSRFVGLLAGCERDEFTPSRLVEAIACYRREVANTEDPRHSAYAGMLLGRALQKQGNSEAAVRENLKLLETPFSLLDDQGVPFAWYAADRLLRNRRTSNAVRERFRRERIEMDAQSSTAAYLLGSIAAQLGDATLEHAAANARAYTGHVELLRADLPNLLPLMRRNGPEPVWMPHGDWLIALSKAPESGKEVLVAVAASRVQPSAPPGSVTDPSHTAIYVSFLVLVLVLVGSGAYLLWRDVQRDIAVAKLRSEFVSSVSHELKTPLTAIRMFAEMLRMRPRCDAPLQKDYLDTIVNESERLSRLVDNVLDFSRIEQSRRMYRLQPTSLSNVIESVVRVIRYPMQQAGFELRVLSERELPAVNADADALQQALLNILTNAMKYSTARKQIDLVAERREHTIVIAVRDYGVGIAAEHKCRIFERFYRVPTPENLHVPGAGLGLTLVAHIVRAHGGEVLVESEPGTGSIFALHLPLEQQA